MLDFKPIQLSDKKWIDPLLAKSQYRGAEYCFGGNFIWQHAYNVQITKRDDFYLVKTEKGGNTSFLFPAGSGNINEIVKLLKEETTSSNIPLRFHGLIEDTKQLLEQSMPGAFAYTEDRDSSDYIYTSESLISLSGKKLHGKRNHIARFKENNNWSFEKITEENIKDCILMSKEWCLQNECNKNCTLTEEQCAIKLSFNHFSSLGFIGGLLRVDGRVIAYTFGEPVSKDTFVVHVEKAFSEVQGAYPMINQQFVTNCCSEYQYINREEDMGIEGLRKAKLSYHPEILQLKYTAVLL